MGRATTPHVSVPYRDDDTASTSSVATLEEHMFIDEEALPAYTDNPNSVDAFRRISSNEAPMSIEAQGGGTFALVPKIHEDSRGSIATYISDPLCSDPKKCEWLAQTEAAKPPEPMIRLVGSHTETRQRDKKEEKERVVDFDISAPLHAFLEQPWRRSKTVENAQKAYRGGIVKRVDPRTKAHPEAAQTPPSLKEWCHRFCASSASIKS